MASLTLREAAEAVGVSKSTLFRAVRAGRLSATRTDDGNFLIDPSGLHRVYEPKKEGRNAAERVEAQSVTQDASASSDVMEWRVRCAETEARAKLAEERLADLKVMLEEMKAEGERWRTQAERLLLAAPAPKTIPE